MPVNGSVTLPASFLQALEEARRNPQSFIAKSGQVKFLPFVGGGAEGDASDPPAAGATGGESSDDSGQSGTDGGQNADSDTEDAEEGDEGLPDNIKAILQKNRREAREAKRKAEEAERKAADAEARAKGYEDRDKSDLEKAQETAAAATKRADELEAANKWLALRSAFLADNSVAWVDPDDALEMALNKFGLGDLEVGSNGAVDRKALRKILADMAKEKDYMVKKEAAGGGTPSGAAFNGGKGSKPKANDEAAMVAKFPAMRGRTKTPNV